MNRREHLLVVLSEECSEITKEVSKALRFGLDDHNPNDPTQNNAQRITKEVADFMGILEMLYDESVIDRPILFDIEEKKKKVEYFLKYAASKGSLNN